MKYLRGSLWVILVLVVLGVFLCGVNSVKAQEVGYEIPSSVADYINSGIISIDETVSSGETLPDIYGVYGANDLNSFMNTNGGSISATVTASGSPSDNSSVSAIYGVNIAGSVSTFTNNGSITSSVQLDNAEGASSFIDVYDVTGANFLGSVGSFNNSGVISANVQLGSASGDSSSVRAYGINSVAFWDDVTGFTNQGEILANVSIGDASGLGSSVSTFYSLLNVGVYGVYFNSDVAEFVNRGTILATIQAGSATGETSEVFAGHVLGVDIAGNVTDEFLNRGNIIASSTAGDAEGPNSSLSVFTVNPVWVDGNTNIFENTGTIWAYGRAGSAIGDSSIVEMYDMGVGFLGTVNSFTNTRKILTSVKAGSAIGGSSSVNVYDIYGVYFYDSVGSFNNNGRISASAVVGDASGSGSSITVDDVVGVGFGNGVGSFTNSGNIRVYVRAGENNVQISDIYSLYMIGGSYLANNGNISLFINAPASAAINNASAIYLSGFDGTLSNTGKIYTSGNATATSLYSSTVTLQDGFGYVFHGNPDTILRPIYVDSSSTLNLNNVPLLAYAANDLRLAKPYYLFDVASGGTINNTLGNLVNEVLNPDITPNWYDSSKQAVTFNFNPKESMPGIGINMATVLLSASNNLLTNFINQLSISEPFLAENTSDKTMLASNVSDVFTLPSGAYKNGMFILPYYTRVNDSGLGANADSSGFLIGYERKLINDNLVGGIFGGYGYNNVDFTGMYDGNSEDQKVYTGGICLIYQQPKWFANLVSSYNRINHDYSGFTGANLDLSETASYDSDTTMSQLLLGYKLEGKRAGFYPYLGIEHIYWNTQSYTTDVSDPNWERHYDSFDDNWFKGIVGFYGVEKQELGNKTNLHLYAGVRLEQTLNDNDKVEIAQSLQGVSAVVKEEIGDTSLVENLGLGLSEDRYVIGLNLAGEQNKDYNAYSVSVQFDIIW
jgi:hypothetical protein